MQMVRYNPFRELLETEKQMNRLLGRSWGRMPALSDVPAVDMYVDKGKLFVEASLPQFSKEEIDVTATDEGLEISAEHEEKEEKETKDRRYILKESSRSYWRQLELPPEAKKGDIKCAFEGGKLTITMPVEEQKKTKAIKIE